jgi:hypothetical protein
MAESFALRTTPDIKAAAKALAGLRCSLYRRGKVLHLGSMNEVLNTLVVCGMPGIVDVLDEKINELKPQLDCVQNLARFLMDNPSAQRVEGGNFPPQSAESRVLAVLEDTKTNVDADGNWAGEFPTDMSEALRELTILLGFRNRRTTRVAVNSAMAMLQEQLSSCVEAKGVVQRCLGNVQVAA